MFEVNLKIRLHQQIITIRFSCINYRNQSKKTGTIFLFIHLKLQKESKSRKRKKGIIKTIFRCKMRVYTMCRIYTICNELILSERNMCLCMCPLLNDSVHRPSSIKCMQTKNFDKLTNTKLELCVCAKTNDWTTKGLVAPCSMLTVQAKRYMHIWQYRVPMNHIMDN